MLLLSWFLHHLLALDSSTIYSTPLILSCPFSLFLPCPAFSYFCCFQPFYLIIPFVTNKTKKGMYRRVVERRVFLFCIIQFVGLASWSPHLLASIPSICTNCCMPLRAFDYKVAMQCAEALAKVRLSIIIAHEETEKRHNLASQEIRVSLISDSGDWTIRAWKIQLRPVREPFTMVAPHCASSTMHL